MMNIVSLLAKQGAKYTRHAYACDVFVTCSIIDKSGNEYQCYRKNKAQLINDTERPIEFYTIDELLNVLGTNAEEISHLDKSKLTPYHRSKRRGYFNRRKLETT